MTTWQELLESFYGDFDVETFADTVVLSQAGHIADVVMAARIGMPEDQMLSMLVTLAKGISAAAAGAMARSFMLHVQMNAEVG